MPSITVRTIGIEQEPVAIVEDFAPDPEALRAAALHAAFRRPKDGHYPGVKAPGDPDYLTDRRTLFATIFRQVFGIAGGVSVLEAGYALVTTPPAILTREQRLPHVDALAPGRLALIHYLVPGECDGTAFYRHRSTGFETVDAERSAAYFAALNNDLRQHGAPPPAYPGGDTAMFERTAVFEGRFNRALIYRGRLLHSGAIGADAVLSDDPAEGRLTITGFFAAQ